MSDQQKILVINAGSSSIKFQLFNYQQTTSHPDFTIVCKGLVERIGLKDSNFIIEIAKGPDFTKHKATLAISDHVVGAQTIITSFISNKVISNFNDIKYLGHRIVHGGQNFTSSTVINSKVMTAIKNCVPLAPLHNPAALKGLASFQKIMPQAQHVAVFDTSFHRTIPQVKAMYSVPYEWFSKYQVQRYGFHGISYRYVLTKLSTILAKKPNAINAIVCHLGNGASICAIKNGASYNTSMGLTPLDGLIMGTRSGIIDPSIHNYICEVKPGATITSVTNDLNKASGLLGISECSSDLRDVIAAHSDGNHPHHEQSCLAITMFVQRIANYIVQYANDLDGNIDALVFTAGIGENSDIIRELVIKEIKLLTLTIDEKNNRASYDDYLKISDKKSQFPIFKIRTNEELMICQDTYDLLIK